MRTKWIMLTVGFAITFGGAVAGWIVFKNVRQAARIEAKAQPTNRQSPVKAPKPVESNPVTKPTPAPQLPPTPPPETTAGAVTSAPVARPALPSVRPRAPQPAPPQVQPANPPQRQLQDPLARVALAYVGTDDPAAEEYWLGAIFDSSLPDEERDDLMEDLNEVGFSDPHNPGPQDLPLILNRLAIIEEVAPYADNFMRPHLWEAYKDLLNMANGQAPQ